jgi:4-hydroxy-tetrahydrodipicolinate reductase
MKLALIGYGAMGQMVANRAITAGDQIGLKITSRDSGRGVDDLAELLRGHDAAIDFSVGAAVLGHIEASIRAAVPLIEGTTGWKDKEAEARSIIQGGNGALVYGANFSIGVNIFYRILGHASALFQHISEYEPFIEEAHHSRKRDAPSGTALNLRDTLASRYKEDIPVSSTRAGYIPGTHRVGFDSVTDQVLLTHMARSREGFATGALAAASWIQGRRGVYEFGEMIDEILSERTKKK